VTFSKAKAHELVETTGIASGAKLWLPVAVRLETECHYALRLLLNSSSLWLKSVATETRRVMPLSEQSFKIDDPALSRRVNRVEVRN
jgi:hypothetical protein